LGFFEASTSDLPLGLLTKALLGSGPRNPRKTWFCSVRWFRACSWAGPFPWVILVSLARLNRIVGSPSQLPNSRRVFNILLSGVPLVLAAPLVPTTRRFRPWARSGKFAHAGPANCSCVRSDVSGLSFGLGRTPQWRLGADVHDGLGWLLVTGRANGLRVSGVQLEPSLGSPRAARPGCSSRLSGVSRWRLCWRGFAALPNSIFNLTAPFGT